MDERRSGAHVDEWGLKFDLEVIGSSGFPAREGVAEFYFRGVRFSMRC